MQFVLFSLCRYCKVFIPDCIGDEKALKRTKEQNYLLVIKAENKIKEAAENLKLGKLVRQGLGFWYHMAGLFGQRWLMIDKIPAVR